MSIDIDYDNIYCPRCNHIGVIPDGDLDWYCPSCGYSGSEGIDEEMEDEEMEDEDDSEEFFSDYYDEYPNNPNLEDD